MTIDWPPQFARTPPRDRSFSHKFSATRRQTVDDIRAETRRMDVDDYHASTGSGGAHTFEDGLPKNTANPDNSAFVLRWSKGGEQYAVGCDRYVRLDQNLREVYMWVRETRKRSDRPVETGGDDFAAAALPPGDSESETPTVTVNDPYEVLGLSPDAPIGVVNAVYRELSKGAHADGGGSTEEMLRLNKARDMIREERKTERAAERGL